jgi:glycosyltransferase involved in cell wall biosynthesis
MEQITIAIPVYNVEQSVARALLSALNQTYSNIEILVIDDKGSDNSMDIAHRIQQEHPRGAVIRTIEHAHNRGTGATRNTAIDNAQGAYLLFLDSDDEITPNCLTLHYEAVKSMNADFSVALYEQIDKTGKTICPDHFTAPTNLEGRDAIKAYYTQDRLGADIEPWNRLYKHSFLTQNNIRCIDHHINEDIILAFLVRLNAQRIALIPAHTYKYYFTKGSTMDKLRSGKEVVRFLTQLEEIIDFELSYALRLVEAPYLHVVLNTILTLFVEMVGKLKPHMTTRDAHNAKKLLKRFIRETKQYPLSKKNLMRAYMLTALPF